MSELREPTCPHSKLRSVTLILRGVDGTPEGVSLSIMCPHCGRAFRFVGIETTATVLLSEDHSELRLLIAGPETEDDEGMVR